MELSWCPRRAGYNAWGATSFCCVLVRISADRRVGLTAAAAAVTR